MFVPKTAEAFTYDQDGNLTSDGRFNYTWDGENRLKQVESLTTGPTASKRRVVWEYDGQGRRIRQTIYTGASGSSGSYVVTPDLKLLNDGWRCVAELNATNSAVVRSYAWGLDLSGSMDSAGGVGGLLLTRNADLGTRNFVAYDGNGNVAALLSAADGTVSANYEYDPFGQTIRSSGPTAKDNPWRFSTKRVDNETDLVWYEYRAYSPSLGRWLSRDPLEEQGFNTLRRGKSATVGRIPVNRRECCHCYAFLRNTPLSDFDFLGLHGGGGGTACRKCGKDVTSLVYQTLRDITDTYEAAPWYYKYIAEVNMFGPASLWNWDIRYLYFYDDANNPNEECRYTVTFEGMCVHANELNYILYGWGMLLCEMDEDYLNLLNHLLWVRYYAGNFGDDTPDSIARKTGFAAYGANILTHLESWLAWPYDCSPTRDKLQDRDFRDWNWKGLKFH